MGLLKGKVAVVTGGARGLGRAIAGRLASEGAVGLCVDLDTDAPDLPDGWHYRRCDVSVEPEVASTLQWVASSFGGLDVLVANAGVVPPWRETVDLDLDDWDAVFAVNVRGVAACLKHGAALMRARGGSVVAMGSINSWMGHPRQAGYVASKHAVLGLVRAAALDLGRFGIRVNALAPGPVATDALVGRVAARAAASGDGAEAALERLASATALGRMASEQDIAGAALYLASDLSAGVTGQMLPVDAGAS